MTAIPKTESDTKLVQLAPYLFFYGRCEEALEFYKATIGGTYELQRIKDGPMSGNVAPDFENKVMHSRFVGRGFEFMASDGRESKAIDPDAGNISLTLTFNDLAEAQRVFQALSQGGKVVMPLEDAFWGGKFGTLTDRFGIEWFVTAP